MFVYILFENQKYYVKDYVVAEHTATYTPHKKDAKKLTQKQLDKIRKLFPNNQYFTVSESH